MKIVVALWPAGQRFCIPIINHEIYVIGTFYILDAHKIKIKIMKFICYNVDFHKRKVLYAY